MAQDVDKHGSRFWTMSPDPAEHAMPYGEATVAIVDENEGGVIAYTSEAHAETLIAALRQATGQV